jgi:hypothetical protein
MPGSLVRIGNSDESNDSAGPSDVNNCAPVALQAFSLRFQIAKTEPLRLHQPAIAEEHRLTVDLPRRRRS